MKFLCKLIVLLQQMANRSYLKSQKLKATEADRQKITLLEAENAALKIRQSRARAEGKDAEGGDPEKLR